MESHWRNSMKPVRFFMLDARSSLPLILLLVHARLSTLLLTVVVMIVFYLLERRGLSFAAATRALRSKIVGRYRPAVLFTARSRFRDYR
jgi:intracellular multiplication protein IcmT